MSKVLDLIKRRPGRQIRKYSTHGMSNSPEYRAWWDMLQRCENPNNKRFKNYGGRGITVSEEFHNIKIWYEHIGPRPGSEYSQDRRNNDGNYERDNIRWITSTEQAKNSRPKSCGPARQRWFRAWHKDIMCQFMSNNQHEFARIHNLSHFCISLCLLGKQHTHKGWIFQRI